MPRRNLAGSNTVAPTESDSFLAQQIHWRPLAAGRQGTKTTVDTIARAARQDAQNPAFQNFANQFRSLADIDQWVRDHFVYRDENEEIYRTPVFMLSDMGRLEANRIVGLEGDCDDVAGFIAAITKALNYPTRLTAIRYDASNPDFEHVFAEAYDAGAWHVLDPTIDEGKTMHAIETLQQVV